MTHLPGHLERILWYASLAPNPHNCQPWKVNVLSDTVGESIEFMVQSDSSRWLPHSDPLNRELALSIGAFWEHLEQAATAFGFEAHTEIVAAETTDTDLLKVKLVKKQQTQDPSSEPLKVMENRYTNRRKYKQKDISPAHLEECQALIPGNLTYFPRQSEKGKWIADNEIDAMQQQVFNDGKQAEMAEWMRFSHAEALEKGDGTTAEMAGFSGFAKFFWYTFLTPKQILSKQVRKSTVQWMKKRVTWCAGFFVITSEDHSAPSLLLAGKILERLWLKCTQLNIHVSPISQLINEAPWNQRLSNELGLSKPAQMIFCAGYPAKQYKNHGHLRRPVRILLFTRLDSDLNP